MEKFINSCKDFVRPVVEPFGEFLGIRTLYAGIILLALAIIFVVSLTLSIVKAVKVKKQKAVALEKAKASANDEKVQQTAIVQQTVDAQNAKEEAPVEQASCEEPAPVTEPVKAPVKQTKAPAKKTLQGKWVVEIKSENEYMSKLLASNGEVMLSSEIYSSEEGARTGISTIIKWVEDGQFVIYQDKKNNYYYKLKTAGNRLICVGEIYSSKEQCESAVETVKRIAKGASISKELIEGERYLDYTPEPLSEEVKGLKGKWKVEKLENGKFSARLYASNGQLMMATEEVLAKKNALAGIEAVKKNALAGNFIVEKDKSGRFYYKLRNIQKSVICIGETYDTLDACISSLESVRRFALNSVVVLEQAE